MDLDYLQNALDNLELKSDLIRNVADYCFTNNINNQEQISNLIEKHFNGHSDSRNKTALFMLSSELFFLANLKKNKLFFKFLAPKIRPFIEALLPSALQNMEIAGMIAASIQKWSVDQLFADSFMDKIKMVAQPIIVKLQQEQRGGGKHQKFTKYKKTTLMQLMDVNKFGPTSKIYQTFVGITDLNLKLNSFQQAYNKIDFQNVNQDTLKRAKQLQRLAEDHRDKLEALICEMHKGFKMVTDECRSDFERLQKND